MKKTSMEIAMKTRISIALAAAALLAAVSAASAAPLEGSTPAPGDTLHLSSAQQQKAWDDLYTGALNQPAPAGFSATIGAVVPSSIATAAMTTKASSDVPALKPYKFAMVEKKLVIVNPSDNRIAEVITR